MSGSAVYIYFLNQEDEPAKRHLEASLKLQADHAKTYKFLALIEYRAGRGKSAREAMDEAGNTSECTQTVTVSDAEAPVITCPADVNTETNVDCTFVGGIGTASATDNCTVSGSIVITSDAPGVFPLGATVVTFHMGGYHDGVDRKVEWKRTVAAIRKAADHASSKHVHLAVDGIWPTWINDSPDVQQRLFDDVDNEHFGINFDPCYLTLMGVDPSKLARRFSKQIVHSHLKDHKGTYPKWTHLLPGRGVLAYDRIFRGLKAAGFTASASVECFTNMKFETACDECYGAMVKAAKGGGVRFTRT